MMVGQAGGQEVSGRRLTHLLLVAAAIGLLVGQAAGVLVSGPWGQGLEQGNPPPASPWTPDQPPTGPNVLIILTDDQRYDTLDTMPRTQRLLFDEAAVFPNAFVTTPVCCPSRASVLTGLYAHNHEVRTNRGVLEASTVAQRLDQAGYFTGLVGKYLNSWPGHDRPEFDRWVSFANGHVRYTDPPLFFGDEERVVDGYVTEILRDEAIRFLLDASLQDAPFFLLFAPNAPHRPATPAPGDERLFADTPWERPPSYDEADVADKPRWVQAQPRVNESQDAAFERTRLSMLRSQAALDRALAAVLYKLDRYHEASRTVVIFLSDNGFFWGEHRLWGKGAPYDEAARVPMAVRYPPLTDGVDESQAVVANIDIVPTIYDLAGIDPPDPVDGRSLVGLLDGTSVWREGVLLEAWSPRAGNWTAAHTGDAVHILYETGERELYDLERDPYQLDNLAGEEGHAELEARLQTLHRDLLDRSGYLDRPS